MEEKQQFINLLKPIKRQLLLQLIWKEFQFLFMGAGAATFLLVIAASFIVIPFLHYYFACLVVGLFFVFLLRIWRGKPDLYKAAQLYNTYVHDDRVVTAFTFLEKDGELEKLQLADAVKHMKKAHSQVLKRKKYFIQYKWLGVGLIFILASILLVFTVSEEKLELAKQRETEIKLVKEAKKELKEKAKEEKEPEVKKLLEEALEVLEDAKDPDKALQELEKQAKNFELQLLKAKEKQQNLESWKNELRENGLNELANLLDEKDLEKLEKELSKLNQNRDELTTEQQKTLNNFSQKEGELSEEEIAQLVKQIEEALESPELIEQLAAAQGKLQDTGLNLQNDMTASGMPPSQLAFAPSNPSGGQSGQGGSVNNGNGQSPSQNGESSQGNNSGNGNGNGSGSGSGSGSDSGPGNGSGSGSGGNGSGAGSGGSGSGSGSSGSGAGLGQGSRELVTVPERISGTGNVETDGGKLGEGSSSSETDGTGPTLKGELRPYNEVYQHYESTYRQSIDRYGLPADLKEIVENYFSNIDPNKE